MYWYPYTTSRTDRHATAASDEMLKKQQTLKKQQASMDLLTLSLQNWQDRTSYALLSSL